MSSNQSRLPFDDDASRTPMAQAGTAPAEPDAVRRGSDTPAAAREAVDRPSGDHPFVLQLRRLCTSHPTRAKWVIVPTHAVGHGIGDRLARHGTSWANLRFVTPLDLAIRMAGPFLVERGIDPSEEPLGPALVMRLLTELPPAPAAAPPGPEGPGLRTTKNRAPGTLTPGTLTPGTSAPGTPAPGTSAPGTRHSAPGTSATPAPGTSAPSGYFRPMATHTSLAAALWSTLRELRLAGVRAAALPGDAFESAEKHAELVALLGAYERHLDAAGVADMAAVFEQAPNHADYCPVGAADLVIETPDVVWPLAVRRFLDGLPGERVTPATVALPGVERPRRWTRLTTRADACEVDAPTDAAKLRYLRAPDRAGPAGNDASLEIFHAGGRDAEIEEVFRRILASGRSLDQVEIVCSSDAHALLAWEKARRLEWPVTVASGQPAAMTRPGRALLSWCDWIDGDFAAGDLRRLLQSGDVSPKALEDTLHAGQAARLLLRAEAAWGRETYRGALTTYAAREEARAGKEEDERAGWRRERAAQSRQLLAWIEDLLAAVPEPDADGGVSLTGVLDAATALLRDAASRRSDLDAAAHVALGDAIDGLRALGTPRVALGLALRFLREAVEATRIGGQRPRPGHLHVASLASTDFDGRPLALVVGLEEGRVFPAAVEDPVLLDAEREAITARLGLAAPLRTSQDRQDEAVFTVMSRLARLGLQAGRVVLSCSCVDTREFRETFPSWVILQAHRIAQGRQDLGYEALRAWLGEPGSAVPPEAEKTLTDAGWWLRAGRAGDAAVAAATAAFAPIARGLEAGRQRAGDAFTSFDGLAPLAGSALDLTTRDRPVSATTLEDAAKCAFRFFLKTGLSIEPIEDRERDTDQWLDPLMRGAELHDLYAAVTRRARDERRRVTRARDLEWFLARGRERLEQLRADLPPPSAEVFEVERDEFLRDLEAFIEDEERHPGAQPIAFEVSFGRALDDTTEPLAREAPVAVPFDAKRRLLLSGRIDRIDRTAPHRYEVIDYKTGRFWRDSYSGVFAGGTLLQHALYSVAAEALLATEDPKAKVTHGVYWFPTGRGWGKRVPIARPADAALSAVLGDFVEMIRQGTFTQTPTKRVCEWCDLAAACGREPWTHGERKIGANVGGRLDAWKRLKERE